jgi:hypothetical protein
MTRLEELREYNEKRLKTFPHDAQCIAMKWLIERVDELKTVLLAIRDYGADSDDGYPQEIVFDKFAYRRIVDSYRQVAEQAIAKLEE